MEKKKKKPGYYIFRAWVTRKDGTRDYAKDHQKKAFPIWIPLSK